MFEEKTESSTIGDQVPLTKDVDLSDENVDKACLSVSRAAPGESGEWSDIQATESRIADVREVASETDRSSLDIPVVNNHGVHEQGSNSFHQG